MSSDKKYNKNRPLDDIKYKIQNLLNKYWQ